MKTLLFLLALIAAAPGPDPEAGDISFDALQAAIKAAPPLPVALPSAPEPVRLPGGPDKYYSDDKQAAANPEIAYESLIAAPVWRASSPAAPKSDLRAGFTQAKHQGSRNLCSVFSATGLAEYLVWKKENRKPDLSEEFLYYNAKLNFTGKPELQSYKGEPGLAGYVAVDALRGGVVRETDWPFLSALPAHTPVPPLLDPDAGTPPPSIYAKKLGYVFSPVAIRRAEIKNFLAAEKRPVAVNLMMYMSSIDNATGRMGDPSDGQRKNCFDSGTDCGGHVVLITGYDPAAGEYIFRNSWGAAWGDAGFGRISEKFLMENCEACHYIPQLETFSPASRAMVVNSSYGWSAALE